MAIETFKTLWNSSTRDPVFELFIAYIVDKKVSSFGTRWMADGQIECIKQWDYILGPVVSEQYETCLDCLVVNDMVYASDWTSYGNAREYTLRPSLREYLLNCPTDMKNFLDNVKSSYMPF